MADLARLENGSIRFVQHPVLKCFHKECVKRLVPGADVNKVILGDGEKGRIFLYHDGSGGLSTVHQNSNAAKDVPLGEGSPQTLIIPFIKIDLQ